eukprot:TRINITY_DN4098_c0_g1_i1.p1 TRINITY_DN4098_c0_g1~~TRINITY_DN4098_c0_g1_i1.p1  ORF type:complete len:436 (-),score=70.15 TRINITY_DN4098_c0_g1_i1:185-1492(-)
MSRRSYIPLDLSEEGGEENTSLDATETTVVDQEQPSNVSNITDASNVNININPDNTSTTSTSIVETGVNAGGAQQSNLQHELLGEDADPNIGAEAASLLDIQNEIRRPPNALSFRKRGNVVVTLYLMVSNIALITSLLADQKNTCQIPLRGWAITQVVLQSTMCFLRIFCFPDLGDTEESRNRARSSPRYLCYNSLSFVWFIWFLVGAVWTFQALSEDICTSSTPFLFRMCFSVVVIQIFIVCILILFCCCMCVVMVLRIVVNPFEFRQPAPRGASESLIKSLPAKKYKSGLTPKEDSNCAICLSDYEEGETVRFLPCHHHYHKDCVDKWLVTNKACPFCKRNVDEPPPTPTSPTQSHNNTSTTSTTTLPPLPSEPYLDSHNEGEVFTDIDLSNNAHGEEDNDEERLELRIGGSTNSPHNTLNPQRHDISKKDIV